MKTRIYATPAVKGLKLFPGLDSIHYKADSYLYTCYNGWDADVMEIAVEKYYNFGVIFLRSLYLTLTCSAETFLV